jgi:hypothetical protein
LRIILEFSTDSRHPRCKPRASLGAETIHCHEATMPGDRT